MYSRSFLSLLLLAFAVTVRAETVSPAEAKLRDALRNTSIQLRTLQAERDTLQAAKDDAEAQKKVVDDKLAALTKQKADDDLAHEKALAAAREALTMRDAQVAQLQTANAKWEVSYKAAVALSEKREAARAKLNSEKIELQRKAADQQRKNQEMYKVGNEILKRYEGFGLGTGVIAREPFVGITRVKLENLVQDYGDKLSDQRIKP